LRRFAGRMKPALQQEWPECNAGRKNQKAKQDSSSRGLAIDLLYTKENEHKREQNAKRGVHIKEVNE